MKGCFEDDSSTHGSILSPIYRTLYSLGALVSACSTLKGRGRWGGGGGFLLLQGIDVLGFRV